MVQLALHALSISAYMYMDSVVGAACGRMGQKCIQRISQKVYHVPFQQGAKALILLSLEAVLSIQPTSGEIWIRLKQRNDWCMPLQIRYPRLGDRKL